MSVLYGQSERAIAEQSARVLKAGLAPRRLLELLGVDTIVTLGAKIYGKPGNGDEARKTLSALSGHRHTVGVIFHDAK